MSEQIYPRLILWPNFDDRARDEIYQKGWFDAKVELEDGKVYMLRFFDQVSFRQEYENAFSKGEFYYAEPNVVIVPDLTIDVVERAVRDLGREPSFYRLLKPE